MIRQTSKLTALALALVLLTAGNLAAAGMSIDSSLITWNAAPGYNLTLTVSGNGQNFRYEFGDGQTPSLSVINEDQLLADGQYTWQIVAAPALSKDEVAVMREARDAGIALSDKAAMGYSESGNFYVADGAFALPNLAEETPNKDQVFADDVIVDGSLCAGIDCANGENFGFDTIRMKENNLRIHFDDTSSSASFPNNDWRLVANDSGNGGANKFSLEDSTAGRTPFTVEAGSIANALYVNAAGDVGVGTATPVVEVHAVDGNSPTYRLEQNGSNGFTPQTWDLAGNETNFFIRDVTNGSKLPFRIEPGASDNRVYIESDDDVGIGTNNPSASLHVRGNGGTTQLLVEEVSGTEATRDMIRIQNNGTARIAMQDTSADGEEWQFAINGGADAFVITNQGSGATEFTLIRADTGANNAGDLTIVGDLFTGAGSCSSGCDAVFRNPVQSIEEHAAFMWENSYLPAVGPTSPEGQWNITEKTSGMLNEIEMAHIYIEQLNDSIKAKDDRIAKLEAAIEELRSLIVAE